MYKTLCDFQEMLVDEVKKISKKGDITPAEMQPAYYAVKTIKMIDEMNGGYGHSEGMYKHMPDYNMSYGRMRSPVTGRYISGGMHSGHSIMDRMVARLESMYDEAQTENERQMVDQWIQRLRSGN